MLSHIPVDQFFISSAVYDFLLRHVKVKCNEYNQMRRNSSLRIKSVNFSPTFAASKIVKKRAVSSKRYVSVCTCVCAIDGGCMTWGDEENTIDDAWRRRCTTINRSCTTCQVRKIPDDWFRRIAMRSERFHHVSIPSRALNFNARKVAMTRSAARSANPQWLSARHPRTI